MAQAVWSGFRLLGGPANSAKFWNSMLFKPPTRKPASRHLPLSRRLLLQLSLGSLAGPVLARERPPLFRTTGYQFTELDPVVPMTPLALQRLDGKAGIAKPTAGRVCLIYLWATWCPLCRTELPQFESQLADFKRDGIDLISICTDEGDPKRVRDYLAHLGVKCLPVFWDAGGKRLAAPRTDGTDSPFTLAMGLPASYVADSAGGVRGYLLGQANWATPAATALLAHFAKA